MSKEAELPENIVRDINNKLDKVGLMVVPAPGGHVVGISASALRRLLDTADKSVGSKVITFVRSLP